jgi:copper chaperone CopZ
MNQYILLFAIIMINISTMYAQTKVDHKMQSKQNESLLSPEHSVAGDTLVYEVFGMDCPGCHGALEKQVNKLNGVDASSANWLNQEIMIVVKKDSVLKEEELFEKIKKANFTPGVKIRK